jgi:hypothetical protein
MSAPRAVQGVFLVVLILFVAASIKHTSSPTFAATRGHRKPSSSSSKPPQSAWSLERLKPQFLGGVRQKLERAEAIWEKTVEQRHKMLKDYRDPSNKDLFVDTISSCMHVCSQLEQVSSPRGRQLPYYAFHDMGFRDSFVQLPV